MKKKILKIGGAILFIFICVSTAHAAKWARNFVLLDNQVIDQDNAAVQQGKRIDFISIQGPLIGPDATTKLPTIPNELRITNPNNSVWGLVGYDTNSMLPLTIPDGHFKHQVSPDLQDAASTIFIRVWNNDETYFAETNTPYYTVNPGDPAAPPLDLPLPPLQTIFPALAPADPVLLDPSITTGVGSAVHPTLTINITAPLGARQFDVRVFHDGVDNGGAAGLDTNHEYPTPASKYKDGYHTLYEGTETVPMGPITLDNAMVDTTVWYQVKAHNSFGDSGWVTGSGTVHKNTDNFPPAVITDLKATIEGNAINLTWTAPYDLNNLSAISNAAAYDIRVSNEAIIGSTADYPPGFNTVFAGSNWDSAISIFDTANSPFADVTRWTPKSWASTSDPSGANEYVPLIGKGTLSGSYYFAVKATDAADNTGWQYLSNVAGVSFGGGTGAAYLKWDFYKPARLGVNQFQFNLNPGAGQIYYSSTRAASNNPTTALEKTGNDYTAKTLVKAINQYAMDDAAVTLPIVNSIGWWKANPTTGEQVMEGYTISYPNGTEPNMVATSSAITQGGDEPLVMNRTYQVSVSQPVGGFSVKQ